MKTNYMLTQLNFKIILACICVLVVAIPATSNAGISFLTIDAGPNATICAGSTHALSATNTCANGSNTFLWTTSGTGSFAPATALISVYTPSAADITAGTVNLTITRTGGGPCSNATSSLTLTILPVFTASAGNAQIICQGGTTGPLGGVVGGAATGGIWSSDSGGTFTPNNTTLNANWTPDAGFSGAAILTLTATGVGTPCSLATATVNITVRPTPTATVGGSQTICQGGQTAALGGQVGGSATSGTWTSNSGGSFLPNATTPAATWSSPPGFTGNATLTLTTTGMAPCAAATATVSVTVISTPTATAGSNQTICQGGTTSGLGGAIGGSATGGTWSSNSGGTFSPNANTLNATWTPPGVFSGNATLTLTTTGMAPCNAATATVSIAVLATATASSGNNQTICQGGTTSGLGGSVGGSATGGTWTSNSGGTFSPNTNTLNATWTPPGGFSGNATLTLTTTGMAPCTATTSTTSITVNATPSANAGSNQTICQGGTTAGLGGAIGGSATGGTWSSSSGGTFSPNANTLNATWTPPGGFSGNATLTLTTTGMAPCVAATATVSVTVNATPTSATGSNQTICQGGTTSGLGGVIGGSAISGTWSSSNGGAFSPNANTLNATWTPPAGFSGSATLTLTATGGVAPCNVSTASVTITVNALPTANTGNNQTICQGGTTTVLSGSVGGSATGGTWSSSNGGTFSPNANNLNAIWTPPGGFSGNATLTLTTTGMAPCAAVTATVNITVSPTPTATAGSNQTICQGGTTSGLGGSVDGSATGGTWSSSNGGTFSPNASNLNATWTPPSDFSGNATLTLSTTGMAPCAASTAIVNVTVNSTPTANTGSNQTICQGGTTATLGGQVGGSATGGAWSSINGGTFSPNANNLNATWSPPAGFSGNATLTLTTTGMAPCAAATSNLMVIVNATPTVNAIDSETICLGSSTSGLNGSVGGSATGGIWSSNSGGTFSPDVNDLNATWTPPAGFNGIATLTLTTTGMEPCDMATKNVEITVNPNLSAEVAYLNNPFCQDLTTDQLPQITGDAVGTFSTPSGLFIDSATGTINPNQSTSGIYNVNYTIPGLIGCPDFVYPLEIVIAPTPIAALDAESPSFMCENSEVSILASSTNIFSNYSSYEWQFLDDDNNPIGSFETGISPLEVLFSIESFTEETTIKVLLTETIGSCSTTSEHQITIRVEPEVCGLFELVGDVLAACSEVGSYYQWGCGPSAIQGQNSNSFVHTAFSVLNSCNAFWVEVSLYSDFSCPVYMGDVSQLTSVENYNYQPSISLYPNPAATLLNLKIDKVLSQDCMFEIISSDGKRISVGYINAGVTQSNIDINHLKSGNYFLSVVVQNVRNVIPFIVSK